MSLLSKRALIIVVVSLAATGLFGVHVGPAFAHANQVRSLPAPNSVLSETPDRVLIWFSEPIEVAYSQIQVLNADGDRVDNQDSVVDLTEPRGMSVSLPPLPDGTYTVAWRNLSSVDGHHVRGSFVFSVGKPSSVATPVTRQPLLQTKVDPAIRWLVLLGGMLVVGGLTFDLLVLIPAMADLSGRSEARLNHKLRWTVWVITVGGTVLLLASSLFQLVMQASITFGEPWHSSLAGSIDVATGSSWGALWLYRVMLTTGVLIVLSVAARPSSSVTSPIFPALVGGVVLSLGSLLTLSLSSHGAAAPGFRFQGVFSDFLHLVAAAIWIGGLAHLSVAAWLSTRSPSESGRAMLDKLVRRFSLPALTSAGVLAVTGLFNGWVEVNTLAAITTPYGWALVTKLGLILPLAALGTVNHFWIRSRLRSSGRAGLQFRWLVSAEVAIGAMVLVAVGWLASMEPARQTVQRTGVGVSGGVQFEDRSDTTIVNLKLLPGVVGQNRFELLIHDQRGRPVENATDVQLTLRFMDADLSENRVSAVRQGGGLYVVDDVFISIAGEWQTEILVIRPDAFDTRTAFRFQSRGASGSVTVGLPRHTGRLLFGGQIAIVGMIILAVGVSLGGWWTRPGVATMLPGVVGLVSGMTLIGLVVLLPSEDDSWRNPFPPTGDSIAIGKAAYVSSCMLCHGISGRGDGPVSISLDPRPSDLVIHVPLHPERDLYRFIRDGISGSAMEPMRGTLTDEEIWHVVNYIQALD